MTTRRAPSGHRCGESHPKATSDDSEVQIVRELHEEHGLGYGTIAEKMELPKSTVRNWCKDYRRS